MNGYLLAFIAGIVCLLIFNSRRTSKKDQEFQKQDGALIQKIQTETSQAAEQQKTAEEAVKTYEEEVRNYDPSLTGPSNDSKS